MGKIIVTGATGFIGSAVVWGLNKRGFDDIVVVDELNSQEKEHNLAPLKYSQIIGGKEWREQLAVGEWDNKNVEAIFHLAAITSTTEKDWKLFEEVNINFSQEIIRWSVDRKVRCVYISSGAVYGDGTLGYGDGAEMFDQYKPLNLYGQSKLNVDIWARDAGYLDEVVGLRYFNVYGPNEWHKGPMRSVVAKKYEEIKEKGVLELFKSNNKKYKDGEQQRDFIYVKDAVAATLHFLDNRKAAGVYNIGTGKARSWNELAKAMFAAVKKPVKIKYIDMPPELEKQYQDFTEADITRLKEAGFKQKMMPLKKAVAEYITKYLKPHCHLGEELKN